MTATESTARLSPAVPAAPPGTAWAWAGVAGGVVGLVGLMATGDLYDVTTGAVADNAALAAAVAERATLVWVQQAVCAAVAACLLVFGTGLRRHLVARTPGGSLLPAVAAGGVLLTAAAVVVGGGIATEMYWALTGPQPFDADTVGAQVTFYNTIAWLWGPLGASAAAVALAGRARRGVGRGVVVFSALMALLLAATQALPVQYAAVLPGALWLVGAGAAFAVGARRSRR
ncbi:hypothetical protein [Pseudonocardia lacus]|uniref:hypothetical protein n=1 Tax=Pseudonocardia lacus TaxID=2835865 RepID=UPI001BDD5A6B|nr:hypothetical protein [Pseudonocardia lacus]